MNMMRGTLLEGVKIEWIHRQLAGLRNKQEQGLLVTYGLSTSGFIDYDIQNSNF